MSLLDKICQSLIKMIRKKGERVLLWENASPTSEMAAQTIAINWKDYDSLCIVLRHYTTDNYISECVIPCISERRGFLNSSLPPTNRYLYLYGRIWTLKTGGIEVGAGYMHDTASNTAAGTSKNSYAIIEKIYGIKNWGGQTS